MRALGVLYIVTVLLPTLATYRALSVTSSPRGTLMPETALLTYPMMKATGDPKGLVSSFSCSMSLSFPLALT